MDFNLYLVQAFNAHEPTDRKPVWAAVSRNLHDTHAIYDAIAHVQLNHADHATEWHLVRVQPLTQDDAPAVFRVPGIVEFRGRWDTPEFQYLNDNLTVNPHLRGV